MLQLMVTLLFFFFPMECTTAYVIIGAQIGTTDNRWGFHSLSNSFSFFSFSIQRLCLYFHNSPWAHLCAAGCVRAHFCGSGVYMYVCVCLLVEAGTLWWPAPVLTWSSLPLWWSEETTQQPLRFSSSIYCLFCPCPPLIVIFSLLPSVSFLWFLVFENSFSICSLPSQRHCPSISSHISWAHGCSGDSFKLCEAFDVWGWTHRTNTHMHIRISTLLCMHWSVGFQKPVVLHHFTS